jgi:predicted SnoaL-like aldol condensation-catalyzing enzyme
MKNLSENKKIVKQFNIEVIQKNNRELFEKLMADDFINHSAPSGNNGKESMWNTFKNVLKPAFPDLEVIIHEMIEENNIVTTRKSITGTHEGELMNIKPTKMKIVIDVIDMVRIENGKYKEHWGQNTFERVIKMLSNA